MALRWRLPATEIAAEGDIPDLISQNANDSNQRHPAALRYFARRDVTDGAGRERASTKAVITKDDAGSEPVQEADLILLHPSRLTLVADSSHGQWSKVMQSFESIPDSALVRMTQASP